MSLARLSRTWAWGCSVVGGVLAPAHGGVSLSFGSRRAAFEEALPMKLDNELRHYQLSFRRLLHLLQFLVLRFE